MTPGTIARRGCGLSSYRSCPRPAATPNPGHPENIHQKPPQEHNDLAAQPADRGFRKAASVSPALSRSSVDMLSWQNLNHIWAMKGVRALQPLQIKEKRNGRWETNPVSTIVRYHNMKGCWPESWCLALQRGVDLPGWSGGIQRCRGQKLSQITPAWIGEWAGEPRNTTGRLRSKFCIQETGWRQLLAYN